MTRFYRIRRTQRVRQIRDRGLSNEKQGKKGCKMKNVKEKRLHYGMR